MNAGKQCASPGPGWLRDSGRSAGPNSPSNRGRAASASAKFLTSELTCTERPPARSIYFWTEDSAAAPSLPWTTSLALCCANDLAIAAPMPRRLPVTIAT
jgi:hypothetical protein